MRITILQGAFFPVPTLLGGGVEKFWQRMAIEFARRGHGVTQISRAMRELPGFSDDQGVRHLRVPGYDQPAGILHLKLCDFFYTVRACRVAPDADVVVTNTFWAPLLLRRQQGRIYVDVQRMPKGQMRLYGRAVRLRANSSAVEAAILAQVPGMGSRVKMIPNALPFVPGRAVDWSRKEKTILYVGRLHPEKGILLLLRSFDRARREGGLSGWKLRLIGPFERGQGGGGAGWKAKLQQLHADPDIEWTGPVFDEERLAEYYERATVFVYPSLAEKGETFGVAPLEAMAWGAVPVVSALTCFQDFITHGENGFVFDHRSREPERNLSDALSLATRVNLRSLAEAATHLRATHAPGGIADRFLADFKKVII